ncbi:carboxylesterase family protein [Aquihabitans sp. McL0605]|uniref:carboxylesterase family protein n=1 Tax=Aquihabitans sp. McL0605 TaxID=3415671 RepID=UPI003CF17807
MRRRHLRPRLIAAAAATCVLLAGCQQLHTQVPKGAGTLRYRDAVFSQVDVSKDVTYGHAADLTGKDVSLELDVYQPHGDAVTARPAIVWVHGGSFKTGEKTSPEIVDEATTFAKKGYLNVSIEYRLSGGCAPFTSQCLDGIAMAYHDAQAAIRFLRANASTYGVDTDRIAVAGTSAGAITAYNVAFGSKSVGHSGNPGYSSKVAAAVSLSGASIGTSPSAGDPPTLDFHGSADPIVPLTWLTSTLTKARTVHLVAEQVLWDGDGHVPYGKHRTEILDDTRNFLYATMDLAHAAR